MFRFLILVCFVLIAPVSLGAIILFDRTQFAAIVPFDNSTNGFVATDVQAAIEELKAQLGAGSRYAVSAGFDGGASVGRYLEFSANVASNQSGFVPARAGVIKEVSCVCQSSATITFTLAKIGGSDLTTCAISASRKGKNTGLSVSIASLDEISVRVTSGSCSRPIVWIYILPQ